MNQPSRRKAACCLRLPLTGSGLAPAQDFLDFRGTADQLGGAFYAGLRAAFRDRSFGWRQLRLDLCRPRPSGLCHMLCTNLAIAAHPGASRHARRLSRNSAIVPDVRPAPFARDWHESEGPLRSPEMSDFPDDRAISPPCPPAVVPSPCARSKPYWASKVWRGIKYTDIVFLFIICSAWRR
jgi:hypothetical protein